MLISAKYYKLGRNTNLMKTKYQVIGEQTRSTSFETLRQRLCTFNNRLSRYHDRKKKKKSKDAKTMPAKQRLHKQRIKTF